MIWDFLKSNDDVTLYLADELINSRLTLFIGSGISLSFNILGWTELVKDVCKQSGVDYSESIEKDVLMKYCKTSLRENYLSTVKKSLYQNYKPELSNIATNELLVSIGAMIIGSKRGKISKVITYNYDDILETYLLYHGYMPNTISRVPYSKIDADIDIYHPHGYLPFIWGKDSKSIVLDQDSYSASSGIDNPFYREIESAVLSTTCLFIGISGRDRAVNDLIIKSKDNHISKYKPNTLFGFIFKLESDLKSYEEDSFKENGIFCIKIKDQKEIALFISNICHQALRIKFKDQLS